MSTDVAATAYFVGFEPAGFNFFVGGSPADIEYVDELIDGVSLFAHVQPLSVALVFVNPLTNHHEREFFPGTILPHKCPRIPQLGVHKKGVRSLLVGNVLRSEQALPSLFELLTNFGKGWSLSYQRCTYRCLDSSFARLILG